MSRTNYSTKRLDHIGLVAGFCQEIGLVKLIDDSMGNQSTQKNLTYGQAVVAMLLNGLGFVGRTLHMYPDYFSDKPIERLLGKGIEPSHINDDVLGRCLDKLYDTGVSDLYQQLAERVITHLGLPCDSIHLDSTSFHVDGSYAFDGGDTQAVKLVKGYSRDHRPELNQVILNLITENQAGIPVYMQAASGNTNDMEGFKQIVKAHISSLKAAQACRYLVADAAMYVGETINELNDQQQLFISRVPQTLNEAKRLIKEHTTADFFAISEGYQGLWHTSKYAGVKQKWLLIKSEQAAYREQQTLNKRMHKQAEISRKSFKKLCQQDFACEADALAAITLWKRSQRYHSVEADVEQVAVHDAVGRPKKSSVAIEHHYKVSGALYTKLSQRQNALQQIGMFIIATNDCDEQLTADKLLLTYKSQQAVEKGFRFLKSPDFLTSSFYLKKPERIEALLMIMTCCLMIYAALEHQIREQLTKQNRFFPDMKKKPTQTPTARWVFQCFQGIDVLKVNENQKMVLNIQERQQVIIDCLGDIYKQIYS